MTKRAFDKRKGEEHTFVKKVLEQKSFVKKDWPAMFDGRQAKRLRGWELEVQKSLPAPLTKGEEGQSSLATKLLNLWAHGKLSATAMQSIAHAAVLDGAEHPELGMLSKAGSFGENPGNVHRDIMGHFCAQVDLCETWDVVIPCLDPKTSKKVEEAASILLPHMLFWQVATMYPDKFHELFATEDLESFWKGVERSKDDRLIGHPICIDKMHVLSKDKTIPLFIHGDGCEFQSRDSLMVWSWGSLLNPSQSLHSHLLLACYPKSATLADTWKPIQRWLKWSFQALLDGCHPSTGPDGEALPKGSVFVALKGQPLSPGNFRCTIWSIQGDHEFYSNVLGMPHWNNRFPCWECDCHQPSTKKTKCPKGKSFKLLTEEQQAYVYVDQEAALSKGYTHPLFEIPGLSSRMIRGDMLHIVFCKGVCSHLVGSILKFFIYFDGKGKQSVAPSDRLAIIFKEVQANYREQEAPTRLTNLKLSMIVDTKKPHAHWPKLDCKGAETKHFCFAFLPVLANLVDESKDEQWHMKVALESLCNLIDIFGHGLMFLSEVQYERARSLAKRFFAAYDFLTEWAKVHKQKLFHVVMKFHTMMHMVKNSKFINPKFLANWRSEDFVGKIALLGHSCSMGTRSTKLSGKILKKYRVLLHLHLTRPGFSQDDAALGDA